MLQHLKYITGAALGLLALGEVGASEADEDGATWRAGAVYTGEAWRAVDGGLATGSSYLDNLDLTLEANAEPRFGLPLKFFAHVLYNNGHSISADLVGDAQGVSSIEGVTAWRLFELWAEWNFGGDSRHAMRYGLYDVNTEFDAIPTAGLFVGASHGMGREFSQSGEHGPSTFPVTGLAARYRWQINDAWSLQTAAVDGVPGDPERPDRTTLELSSEEGALLIGEVARESERFTKLALGIWQYTAEFDDLSAVDANGEPLQRRSNHGVYAFADAALIEAPNAASPKLSAFVRFGVANGDLNRFDQYLGAGLVLRGALTSTGDDELGLAVSRATNGEKYRGEQAALGAPLESTETNIELTWQARVNDWLTLQPDIQYVINPNTDPGRRNAWVVGLRFTLELMQEG